MTSGSGSVETAPVSILGVIDEIARQKALDNLHIVDTAPEERFDRVARLARQLFAVETVLITLLDHDRHWFKSRVGMDEKEGSRRDAFCDVTIQQPDTLVVPNALEDPRFRSNPSVTGGPKIRFYAGHPLEAPNGERVGTLCIFDPQPRVFSETEQRALRDLALWVQHELSVSSELERAAEVQRGLQPKQFISLPGYDVAGGCSPAHVVGGDFFDWYPVGEGAAFTLADVMGKGFASALIAATVRAVLRTGSRQRKIIAAVESAAALLDSDLNEAGTFVTLFHARLDMHTGRVRYIDAGHGLSLKVSADGSSTRLTALNLPLGANSDEAWTKQVVTLDPGDTLISVSDGVLDLFDGTLATLDEIEGIVRASATAQDIVDTVMERAGTSAPDDVTVVVVRRRP